MNVYYLGTNFLNQLPFARKFQVILFTLLLPIAYSSWLNFNAEQSKINTINIMNCVFWPLSTGGRQPNGWRVINQ